MKHKRPFTRKRLLLALASSLACAMGATHLLYPQPRYDLLFSIDYNGIPYSDPDSPGMVVRVNENKATAFYTSKPEPVIGFSKPSLYVCKAANGRVHEIQITFAPPTSPPSVDTPFFAGAHPIKVPELHLLTLNPSSEAPDGYALRGFNALYGSNGTPAKIRFDRTYAYAILVETLVPVQQIRVEGGDDRKLFMQMEDSTYKHCLEQVGNHNTALTTHFIGWVLPP